MILAVLNITLIGVFFRGRGWQRTSSGILDRAVMSADAGHMHSPIQQALDYRLGIEMSFSQGPRVICSSVLFNQTCWQPVSPPTKKIVSHAHVLECSYTIGQLLMLTAGANFGAPSSFFFFLSLAKTKGGRGGGEGMADFVAGSVHQAASSHSPFQSLICEEMDRSRLLHMSFPFEFNKSVSSSSI